MFPATSGSSPNYRERRQESAVSYCFWFFPPDNLLPEVIEETDKKRQSSHSPYKDEPYPLDSTRSAC
jgi:hypothetical protein